MKLYLLLLTFFHKGQVQSRFITKETIMSNHARHVIIVTKDLDVNDIIQNIKGYSKYSYKIPENTTQFTFGDPDKMPDNTEFIYTYPKRKFTSDIIPRIQFSVRLKTETNQLWNEMSEITSTN